jgi:hypothetical protein
MLVVSISFPVFQLVIECKSFPIIWGAVPAKIYTARQFKLTTIGSGLVVVVPGLGNNFGVKLTEKIPSGKKMNPARYGPGYILSRGVKCLVYILQGCFELVESPKGIKKSYTPAPPA